MKKRILLLVCILLLTGCSCNYNLTINDNTFSEEIKITGETTNEVESLNSKWKIPVDKDEYSIGTDPSTKSLPVTNTYNYKISGSTLNLNYNYEKYEYINATSVSNCFKKITIENYDDNTIISTSKGVLCLDKYPNLNKLVINITVDRPVKKHNADQKNGKTYIWTINKNNAKNKDINLILDNSTSDTKKQNSISTDNKNNNKNNSSNNSNKIINSITNEIERDYSLYIFAIVLLINALIIYFTIKKIKNREDVMDD